MDLENTISIQTPEGVVLDVPLAGVGSRLVAQIIDAIIRFVAAGLIVLFLGGIDFDASLVVLILATFLLLVAYELVFEAFWAGQTPGKRAVGIRVVRVNGGPITFFASSVRNLLRIIDILPSVYAIGFLFALFTRRGQRLGDLAAGTVVIRHTTARQAAAPRSTFGSVEIPSGFDATAVTQNHVAAARAFLDRRDDLDPLTRRRLAASIATELRAAVGTTGESLGDEPLIEAVVVVKTSNR